MTWDDERRESLLDAVHLPAGQLPLGNPRLFSLPNKISLDVCEALAKGEPKWNPVARAKSQERRKSTTGDQVARKTARLSAEGLDSTRAAYTRLDEIKMDVAIEAQRALYLELGCGDTKVRGWRI